MSDELRAAAERFREYERLADAGEGLQDYEQIDDDIIDLARAYLASSLADDGEPLTMDWWKSLNSNSRFLCKQRYTLQVEDDGSFQMDADVWLEECMLFSIPLPHVQTRGDVRRLCAALGIELKEKEQP